MDKRPRAAWPAIFSAEIGALGLAQVCIRLFTTGNIMFWLTLGWAMLAVGVLGFTCFACVRPTGASPLASAAADEQPIATALFWLDERSAWGRCRAASDLAKNDHEWNEEMRMRWAMNAIEGRAHKGDIVILGVPRGGSGFEPISSGLLKTRASFWLEPDQAQRWKVRLGPYGTKMTSGGSEPVTSIEPTKPEIVALLPVYDWLAVDMNRVKALWPEHDKKLDGKTAKLTKEYRRKLGV